MGKRKIIKSTEDYILEASRNIDEDRKLASKLLSDIMQRLEETKENTLSQRRLGEVAAKYLETLQRSNEQLVKLTSIVQEQEELNKDEDDLNAEDIFNSINSGE
jgi:hypothetical protein